MSGFNQPVAHEKFRDLDDLRAFARKLIDLWDREVDRPFNMKVSYSAAAGPMIWSLTNHTVELMRTVLLLSEQDRLLVALPLIRFTMDNGMTCAWLLKSNKAAALVHEGMRQRKAAIGSVVALGAPGFDDATMKKAANELEEFEWAQDAEGQHIEKRMQSLVDGDGVYSSYRIASSLSHAGMTLADQYLVEQSRTPDNPMGLAFTPHEKLEAHEAWLGTSICMLLLSLKTVNETSSDGPFKTQLERAIKRMGVELDIKLKPSPQGRKPASPALKRRNIESLASAVAQAGIAWRAVEAFWNPEQASRGTPDNNGRDFVALRLWLALVYVGLETWHAISGEVPSDELDAFWAHPHCRRLKDLRNKTFHYGGSLLPKEVAAFWDRPDAFRWAVDVADALGRLTAEHFLEWSADRRDATFGSADPKER